MMWIGILVLVVVMVALIGLSGTRVEGGRPVGGTRLMTAARIVLVLLAVVVAYGVWGS